MANVLVAEQSLQDIADAIREKTETEDTFKPSEMGEAIRGISSGGITPSGTIEITENGTYDVTEYASASVEVQSGSGDSYYDVFWDNYQDYGKRTNYNNAFASAWSNSSFRPKYDMHVKTADSMFNNSKISNLAQILNECNVVLDTSDATTFQYAFATCSVKNIPTLSFENATGVYSTHMMFYANSGLKTIEKIIVCSTTYLNSSTFSGTSGLEHCPYEGEMGNSIYMSSCILLDNESAKSLLLCLVNYTGTEKEFVNTVKFHADVWVRLDAEGETSPTGTTWKKYVEDKGWLY